MISNKTVTAIFALITGSCVHAASTGISDMAAKPSCFVEISSESNFYSINATWIREMVITKNEDKYVVKLKMASNYGLNSEYSFSQPDYNKALLFARAISNKANNGCK